MHLKRSDAEQVRRSLDIPALFSERGEIESPDEQTSIGNLKIVEVAGLAGMINVLGGMVAMLLAVLMGNMAVTPGPVLLLREFDPANRLHAFLAHLNAFMPWYIVIVSPGLAKPGRDLVWQGGALALRGLGGVGRGGGGSGLGPLAQPSCRTQAPKSVPRATFVRRRSD